ncbi:MAG: sugar phosphate isomerase/epimerase [Deltaproteobacteria bacterium]|nr:MAG: sugar phosphate isomerase/epimerase [Deltaproteobacteria bacterium]
MERVVGKEIKGEDLSIENLFYPLALIQSLIDDFQLSVCLDIGHLVLSKQDIEKNVDEWRKKITIIHLHGADGEKDHLGLDQMPLAQMEKIMAKLRGYTGIVSLEVFSFSKLYNSMEILKNFLDL